MEKLNVGWGAIAKCNMNCAFCYSKFKRLSLKNNLGYKDWINFVDNNNSLINSINYGTGENTLSPDWFKLVYYVRHKYPHIRQALTTNGYLSVAVKDDFALKAFVEAIDEVDVSLDFADESKHNSFRGQPNAYAWAIQTLDLCQRYNKRLTIVFLGSSKNVYVENIDGLFNIARKHNAVLRMNIYRPTEGVNSFSKQFILGYTQLRDILHYINDNYHILKIDDPLFASIFCNVTNNDPSGSKSIRILSDGSITPSTYLITNDYIVGNITEDDVLAKIQSNGKMSQLIKKVIPDDCKGCSYVDTCAGGVYDRRYLWYESLNYKDPYCPKFFNEKNKRDIIKCAPSDDSFSSVHDGYLPTMFFKY